MPDPIKPIPQTSPVTARPARKPDIKTDVKITDEDPVDRQQRRVNYFQQSLDNLKPEAGPSEKQLRNQRFWAGLGDAMSGIAGLISAANGGMAIDTSGKTAIGAVRDAQEEARKRRREKFNQDYALASDRLKREGDYLAQLRANKQAQLAASYAAAKEKREQAAHEQTMTIQKQKANDDHEYHQYLMGKPYYNPNSNTGSTPTSNRILRGPDGTSYSFTSGAFTSARSTLFSMVPQTFLRSLPPQYFDPATRNILTSQYENIIHLYANSADGQADTAFWDAVKRASGAPSSASHGGTPPKKTVPKGGSGAGGSTGAGDEWH